VRIPKFPLILAGLALAAGLSACAHTAPFAGRAGETLRAMTFNIRLDTASDGANAWPYRKDIVSQTIAYHEPDVIGFQEVLLNQKQDLEAALPSYRFAGVARDDGRTKGEFSPLAWKTARFEAVESGTFWLSPTPDTPSKGWDASLPRIASWALLQDRRTGQRIRVLNTHFDHVGEEARRESAAQIAAWAKRYRDAGEAVLVMGDFNAAPSSAPIQILADPGRSGLANTRTISRSPPYGPTGTFTAFDITRNADEPIDHIFVSEGLGVIRHATITQHWGGRLPSDHYPVLADIELESR
jgi:endonuclease/exonuclease/phosphatase family metal-dependent hydrolase